MKLSKFRGKDIKEMVLASAVIAVVIILVAVFGIWQGMHVLKPMLEARIAEEKERRAKQEAEEAKQEAEEAKQAAEEEKRAEEARIAEIKSNIPESAYEYNGHYYYIYDDAESWEYARDQCEELGGHLATVTSAKEDKKLYKYIRSEDYSRVYLGLYTDSESDETGWEWVTGEEMSYTNWTEGEPDIGDDEDCLYGTYCEEDRSKWRALNATSTTTYVCEWEPLGEEEQQEEVESEVDILSNSLQFEDRKEESGEKEIVKEDTEVSEEESQDYIIPDSNRRYLERSDFENLSKEELRLARNEIYARNGRLFADVELQAYFDAKEWYQGSISPEDFNEESMLNDYEFENAKRISAYESEMGY